MPAEITTGEYCASWFATYKVEGSKGDVYTVSLSGGEGPVHCTCPAFRYRDDCKHIKHVLDHACLWNCQWHDGNEEVTLRPEAITVDPITRSACANCGGPLVPVRIAI